MALSSASLLSLDAAYEEIRAGKWWLPAGAREIDGGDFFAQMKAPTRVPEHYRHAHAFDHLAGAGRVYAMAMMTGTLESLRL